MNGIHVGISKVAAVVASHAEVLNRMKCKVVTVLAHVAFV
jgi:hypothetical protein